MVSQIDELYVSVSLTDNLKYCFCSHEVVWVEVIVPSSLIIGCVHVECVVIDALIVPFTVLIEQVHLFRVSVRVDHVQVQAGVLLEEWTP